MFYLVGCLRTQVQETASPRALRDHSEEVRAEPGYTGVFATKPEHQKITVH